MHMCLLCVFGINVCIHGSSAAASWVWLWPGGCGLVVVASCVHNTSSSMSRRTKNNPVLIGEPGGLACLALVLLICGCGLAVVTLGVHNTSSSMSLRTKNNPVLIGEPGGLAYIRTCVGVVSSLQSVAALCRCGPACCCYGAGAAHRC
jgi:hypothetical protein